VSVPYYSDALVTIYHGDCRDILPTLRGDAVISDPPYGIGVPYGPSYDDARPDYWDWLRERLVLMRAAAPVVAFTHRVRALAELPEWDWIAVWNKGGAFGSRVGNSPIVAGWEPIFLYGIHSIGTKTKGMSDVLTVRPEPAGNAGAFVGREKWAKGAVAKHPVPKPMSLYRHLIGALSVPGGTVIDPFAGTGTTLAAAKDLGRKSIGIEIEEVYCEQAAVAASQEVLGLVG
jgi:site-specific DNA-methyltransferase (adenine-specific)